MVLVKMKQYDLKAEIFKARDRLRDLSIRVANELTMLQRNKIKDLPQRGIQAYYKNGVLYQRQMSADNKNFARAHCKLSEDKAMDAANASTPSVGSAEQHVDYDRGQVPKIYPTSYSILSILSYNISGLKSKLNDAFFKDYISSFDIVILLETWEVHIDLIYQCSSLQGFVCYVSPARGI
ncbi:hypothetical protein DPMN_062082 [Dreissena polymorpha]|uniref:Uncharacterized protein n=1 Tax=Dreissena polymorpha TaxID=45954 RepID=A0A9D4C912_DREPO|nr:hypothetical protein DPMN_062082 [Dreissena polymorpha]